jgi:hypothetical protein
MKRRLTGLAALLGIIVLLGATAGPMAADALRAYIGESFGPKVSGLDELTAIEVAYIKGWDAVVESEATIGEKSVLLIPVVQQYAASLATLVIPAEAEPHRQSVLRSAQSLVTLLQQITAPSPLVAQANEVMRGMREQRHALYTAMGGDPADISTL